MKKSRYLQYHWWMYLVVALAVVLVWSYVFSVIAQPKSNEKIAIAIFDNNVQQKQLYDGIANNVVTNSQQNIKKITVECFGDLGSSLHDMVVSRTILSDLVVVPQSMIATKDNQVDKIRTDNFAPIPTQKIEDVLGQLDYYVVDGVAMGIVLNSDDGATNNFEKAYTGSDLCVLFLCNESPNLGGIYNVGSDADDVALQTIKYLLEVANG